jgi:hypothetical protein
MSEIYAIGDVHGCYDTLMAMIKTIDLKDEDILISCGDLVDRGPKIREVLDYFLNRPNTYVTKSNHDFAFQQYVLGQKTKYDFMLEQGLQETLDQLGSDAERYVKEIAKFPVIIDDPDGKYIFCHATYNWHPGEVFMEDHLWSRWYYEDKDAYSIYPVDAPIIVHGHTPVPSGQDYYERVNGRLIGINLDGGCCFNIPGACLRVLQVSNGKIFEELNVDVIT